MTDAQHLLDRRKAFLGPAYQLFYNEPVHLVRGEGVWLFDAAGKKYLDMYNNVPHVGHCHPQVVAALTRQIATLNTHTRYLHGLVVDYAERLIEKLPQSLDTAMFTCTGTEANELALRIARTASGGTGIVVVENAYHGNSHAIAQISPSDYTSEGVPKFVRVVPAPNSYSGLHRDEDAAAKYADYVAQAIAELNENGIQLAAVVMDTILSGPGVVEPPPGYLAKVAGMARNAGGFFVADEVQPGFGRTGRAFWGFEADSFVPDIVTMGKPMGNGYPLAGVVAGSDLVRDFSRHEHYFNTFGGNPVAAAAGMAVLDVIEEENLQGNARDLGKTLRQGIASIAETQPIVGDIRGHGLFIGVELIEDPASLKPAAAATELLINDLKDRGVLTGSIGPHSNIIKLRPPLVFTKSDADVFLEKFAVSLAKLNS